MTRLLLRRSFLLLFLALGGCASAPPPLEPGEPMPRQTLHPGDIVRVVVWREEDLSGDFMVDPSGHVILPRVGKWDVGDETESSLEARLTAALEEELRNATVDVVVLRRIQIVGAVERPGLYSLDATMTLGQALAQAGGVAPTGKKGLLEIVRDGDRYTIRYARDRRLTDAPLRSGDVLYVPERNWFLRNYGAVITAVSSAAGVAAVIITSSNNE